LLALFATTRPSYNTIINHLNHLHSKPGGQVDNFIVETETFPASPFSKGCSAHDSSRFWSNEKEDDGPRLWA
jgi:hypothetical protein